MAARRTQKTAPVTLKFDGSVTGRLPERFSPSRVSTFLQCPAKFAFSTILKLPQVPTAAQLRGTLAHEAIEKVFELPAEQRTPDATAAGVRPAWERLDAESDRYETLRGEVDTIIAEAESMCRNWFRIEDPTKIEPEACETWVRGVVGGMSMHGIIDRLDQVQLKNGHTAIVVSDYKSAVKVPKADDRFIDDKFFGLEAYAAMLADNGRQPAAVRLVFIAGDGPDSALLRRIDDRKLVEVNAKIKAAHTDIKRSARAGEFRCRTGPLCNWCDYQDMCPAFNKLLEGVVVEVDSDAA